MRVVKSCYQRFNFEVLEVCLPYPFTPFARPNLAVGGGCGGRVRTHYRGEGRASSTAGTCYDDTCLFTKGGDLGSGAGGVLAWAGPPAQAKGPLGPFPLGLGAPATTTLVSCSVVFLGALGDRGVWLGPEHRPKPGAPSAPSPGRKKRCREGETGLLAWAGCPAQAKCTLTPFPLNTSPLT